MNYNEIRRRTREIKVGGKYVGGKGAITVQSMTNTDTHDFDATYAQIKSLQDAGCDIVRITVPDVDAAKTIYKLKNSDINIPVVADIHFDYKIALQSIAAGADKIRINPGNIGSDEKVKAVAAACREKDIPIRIGVNSGSLERHILEKYGSPTPQALAESAFYHASLLEKFDFNDIIISVKSSDVYTMIKANKIIAEKCDYPLHLGVTEAGRGESGTVKSAVGIGSLLSSGIGDTIRVSLTDKPENEIIAAKAILRSLDLTGENYINIISCPTCGRTKINLIKICEELEQELKDIGKMNKKITVAVMGCVVNGPGEAKEADIGIAGGDGFAVLFRKGEIIRRIEEKNITGELISEIKKISDVER